MLGVTRNWAKTVVNWNLALDPSGGPHNGGCDTCTGVVTVGPTTPSPRNAEYYTLGHLARFVQPGAVRIASTSFGTTGWNGQIMDAAFRNPDGSTALVVHNENDDPRTFAVAAGRPSFEYTLPGGALATFMWPASPALDDGRVLLDAHGTTATASPAAAAGNAVDDDATTRWTTGAAQSRASRCRSTSASRSACGASCSTPAPTRVTSRAATRCPPAPTGRIWTRGCHRRRPRPADHDRHPRDRSPLPAGRPDRDRAAVVVGRRRAGLPLRRRDMKTYLRTVILIAAALAVGAPAASAAPYEDATQPVSTRVADLLSRMTLEEKVGQMTQTERRPRST